MANCECCDRLCPVHEGAECGRKGSQLLYRVDMEDRTGTLMCRFCANDAFESGLFRPATVKEKIKYRR
jgi:hypothetical protein